MKYKLAKNAGYCFGVKRAMNMAWDELKNSQNIFALGPLIHNKQAVSKYEEMGLITVDSVDDVLENKHMIIRSHGVGEDIYLKAKDKNIKIIDTTCPFVKKIHDIVKNAYNNNEKIILIGDKSHPEVIGINGWCNNSAIIIKNEEDLKNIEFNDSKKYCVVAQTTINMDNYKKIKNILDEKLKNKYFNNTICLATKERQETAKDLSSEVDCMIVVGGHHSSNTAKLVDICKENASTFAIETKDELKNIDLSNFNVVGITAGASTPDWIIQEVIEYINNL